MDLTGLEGLERLTRLARGVRLLRDLPWLDLVLAVYAQARRAAGVTSAAEVALAVTALGLQTPSGLRRYLATWA